MCSIRPLTIFIWRRLRLCAATPLISRLLSAACAVRSHLTTSPIVASTRGSVDNSSLNGFFKGTRFARGVLKALGGGRQSPVGSVGATSGGSSWDGSADDSGRTVLPSGGSPCVSPGLIGCEGGVAERDPP